MRHMKLKYIAKLNRPSSKKASQESGQTLHEVLIASSILAITISGFTSSIIRSNQITHKASLRNVAESVMSNDLESTVKRRFYTYRCKQGPCMDAIDENDNSLMYFEERNSDDKQDFIRLCNERDHARELLSENEGGVNEEEQLIKEIRSPNQNITITRNITLDDSNNNQAIVEYEAEQGSEVIATMKAILVPNAVHWCS